MPLRSRRIQYLVRELYRERDRSYVLVRGMLDRDDEITIASKMPQGRIYIDGSRTVYRFPFGMRAKIRLSDYPLNIFVRQ